LADTLTALLLFCAGAALVLAAIVWLRGRRSGSRTPARRPRRFVRVDGRRRLRRAPPAAASDAPAGWRPGVGVALVGLALVVGSLGAGLYLLSVEEAETPEHRGIGVLPSVEARPRRGLAVSTAVRVTSCSKPVQVTLVVTGSTEYWVDHRDELRDHGDVQVGVPDLNLHNIEAGLGVDGKTAPIAPWTEEPNRTAELVKLPTHEKKLQSVTVLGVRVRHWSRHLRPVVFRFGADWLSRRDRLGSCYLSLPALAGPTTVLSAQEVRGQARRELDCEKLDCSIEDVRSSKTGLRAYYHPRYETTRGLAVALTGSNTVRADLASPPPDGNSGGSQSWTCATRPTARTFKFIENVRRGDDPDVVEGESSGAVSIRRLSGATSERNCASFAVIEEATAQLRRDVTLLLLGVLISAGVTLMVEAWLARRTRRDENMGR